MSFNFFKKQKVAEGMNMFLHVPKAGGSTFVGLLKDSIRISNDQKKIPTHLIEKIGNVDIKHVDFSTSARQFKASDIFSIEKRDFYQKNYKLFLLLRNPVDRIISEFNFQYHLLNGKNGNKNAAIISKLHPLPNTLEKYMKFPHTHNYQIKFLLGRKIADPHPINKSDFEMVISSIEELPIHCGLTSSFDTFLSCFEENAGIKLKRNVVVRKKTPSDLKIQPDENLKKKILVVNNWDNELYLYVKEKIKKSEYTANGKFNYKKGDEFVV